MTSYQISETNCETGETTIRPMTEEEIAVQQHAEEEHAKQQAELVADAAAKEALLSKLGITADEAKLLLS
jgi:hypothetical protein